jgi:NAD(P)H-flavin reductase
MPEPELVASGPELTAEGLLLLEKADLMFISSSNADIDMDTNNRGGPAGYIRAISKTEIIYPEYSGNRLYQSLGNLINNPAISLCIPDFETGDALYITGIAEVLIGDSAASLLPRTKLAVKVKILDSRLVRKGLSMRGFKGEASPYNPPVRLLVNESEVAAGIQNKPEGTATLVGKDELSPTITRYRFKADHPVEYQPGQWVALDFSEELDIGYSHMREDDPTSLNDDFVRTFTISSHPSELAENEFEIIARLHGPVTEFLKRQRMASRNPLEIQMRGFGGNFKLKSTGDNEIMPFIAGGVGITPLLGQLKNLDLGKLRLLWITKADDVSFVKDIFDRYPGLTKVTTLFLTGEDSNFTKVIKDLEESGTIVKKGRPSGKSEILEVAPQAQNWYLCAGKLLRKQLLEWLSGKKVEFEDFDY